MQKKPAFLPMHYIVILCTFLFPLAITKPVNHIGVTVSEYFKSSKNEIVTPAADAPIVDTATERTSRLDTIQFHTKQKRNSREIRECPSYYIWVASECRHQIHPQRYLNRCIWNGLPTNPARIPLAVMTFLGNCEPDEFCVEGGSASSKRAFCVSGDDLMQWIISNSPKNIVAPAPQVGLPSTSKGASQYSLDALLTGSNTLQTINATSLRIQAQKRVNVHGNFVTQTLPGGTVECTNCASVSLDPVPDGTQSISVDLVVEEVATLHLGSIKP